MPNIITHDLFCKEVLKEIQDDLLKSKIEKYMQEYRIGSNGPDFLFFHNIYALNKKAKKRISKYGGMLHTSKVNTFYETAIKAYHNQIVGDEKDAMYVYIIGHYLHHQLDSIMHPYVYYNVGWGSIESSFYHHTFESMMDTMLLNYYEHKTIKEYNTPALCKTNAFTNTVISNVYVPCIKQCFKENIKKADIKKSLNDWYLSQRILYDPSGFKYKNIKFIEKKVHFEFLSGSIVPIEEDKEHDILNLKHSVWLNPVTGIPSNQSVFDLINEAIELTKIGLPLLLDALDHYKIKPFLSFLSDKDYGTGLPGNLERKYKDVIYK